MDRVAFSVQERRLTGHIFRSASTQLPCPGILFVHGLGSSQNGYRQRAERMTQAINSAALLLRSANDKHPRGLANRSDVVGRHYMGHTNGIVLALSRCANPTIFQKTLAVNDFERTYRTICPSLHRSELIGTETSNSRPANVEILPSSGHFLATLSLFHIHTSFSP